MVESGREPKEKVEVEFFSLSFRLSSLIIGKSSAIEPVSGTLASFPLLLYLSRGTTRITMSRHSRGIKAITSSSESSSSDDDDAFGRRQRKLKLSLEALEPVSTSVERAPPHHRSRAALEVAELLLQAYLEAKKEVKAEIERLAFSFYVLRGSTVKSPSPFSPSCSSSLPPCLAARSRLERAAASSLPEARRKSFLRAVRDASIAEKRGGKAAAAGGGGGDAEAAATASASASADEDADGSNSLALSSELFELVPDVIRHVANFLAPVDALAAACVCEF